MVFYQTANTKTFAGECGLRGYLDGLLLDARFKYLWAMTRHPIDPRIIYLTARLRKINFETSKILTLDIRPAVIGRPIWHEFRLDKSGPLIAADYFAIYVAKFLTNHLEAITGRFRELDTACDSCAFSEARFNNIQAVSPSMLR